MKYLKGFLAGIAAFSVTLILWVMAGWPTGIEVGETISALDTRAMIPMLGTALISFAAVFYLMVNAVSSRRSL
ncbi:MAG TPA: hypothetical protein VFO86_14785 [Terriglobia bacterium]|nr:hypothetical protein [Terriglobia bacterium]